MVKTKTLCVQKKSTKTTPKVRIKKGAKVFPYSPTQELLDETLVRNAIWECLKNNNPAGIMEVLDIHFEALSRVAVCREASLPRSTLYHNLKKKNPTLKTLAKLVSASYMHVDK